MCARTRASRVMTPTGEKSRSGRSRAQSARLQLVWLLLAFLLPVALLIPGLVLDITWLIVAGAALCPFAPVITGLLIRRHSVDEGPSHCREP